LNIDEVFFANSVGDHDITKLAIPTLGNVMQNRNATIEQYILDTYEGKQLSLAATDV
jgi:hypothetical protein